MSLIERLIPLLGRSIAGGELALTLPLSLPFLERGLSDFVPSIAGGCIIYSFVNFFVLLYKFQAKTGLIPYSLVIFYVIDLTDPFRIRLVNGRRWHHLDLCFFSVIKRTDNFIICSVICML